MPAITLKGIPPFLHVELKKRAEMNKRSLNNEILVCLESFLGFRIFEKNQYLEEVREFRKTIKSKITQKMIDDSKDEGRK
ncbi:MAG: DNA-binding protein [Candidatus Riflebacteria bacterium]|nr:DNA-binding protein [Candidatus Riflebacteria bacterium]